MTTTTPPLDLDTITLGKGVHSKGSTEPCLLELSAWLAGEPWTDRPACVSPVLGAFGRSFNDALPTDRRQRLRPYAPRLLNTAGDAQADERRSYLALDWLVRTYLPTWLRLVPALTTQADLLSAAHEVTDLDSAAAIGDLVREAASQSSAAGDAARAALAPTVDALQDSAFDLLDRMLSVSA